ncbi:type II secretion system protein GspM [Pseudohongiella spirulinae]|uniref:General secretion pathway protein M n=1 Tax=Pseudohongiella spirulinae TaxID=1249552 RepID=A0A0S2K8R4_9GAMM|nr:type II secretion system protein GspM [Pseudohongiella spirulinae]ALO44743.1 hypothetical protein PS2015_45 [Pseudohongiella spirulinae]
MMRQLTAREKTILRAALVVALLWLVSNGVPQLRSIHQERALNISQLRDSIDREQRLIDDAEQWAQRRQSTEAQEPDLQNKVFSGSSTAMLTAAIQRQLRQLASEAGVNITSTRLAETSQSGDWLQMQQSVSFTTTDQTAIMRLLQQLENSQPYLGVVDFSLRRARNQFTGELTVVGFSREAGDA